jgi:hypothetical protein
MDAHTCQHCDPIVIPLNNRGAPVRFSKHCLDVAAVKSAVRDGCAFFLWALAIEPDGLPDSNQNEYLNKHIMNLLGYSGWGNDKSSLLESPQESGNSDECKSVESDEDAAEADVWPQLTLDTSSDPLPQSLSLHLSTIVRWTPRRCSLLRDIARIDARTPRPDCDWTGPQLDLVAPRGTLPTTSVPCTNPLMLGASSIVLAKVNQEAHSPPSLTQDPS